MASTGKRSGIAVAPATAGTPRLGGARLWGVAGMTEWSRRKGLGLPPRPDELGGEGDPRSLPLPHQAGWFWNLSAAASRARASPWPGRAEPGRASFVWRLSGPGAPGLSPRGRSLGPPRARRGPRLGLEPITPKAREAGCLMAAREAVAGFP